MVVDNISWFVVPPLPTPKNFFHFYGPVSATKFIESVTFLRFYFFNFLNIYFFFVSKFFLFPFNQYLGHSLIFGRRNGILIKLSLNFFDYWLKLKDKIWKKDFKGLKTSQRFCNSRLIVKLYTAWKVSIFGVFLVPIFPFAFGLNTGKYGPEKLEIRTLFTQCYFYKLYSAQLPIPVSNFR